MTQKHVDRRILALAIGGALPLLALSLPATAQVATGNDGRALDANNRVGSGGMNDRGGGGTPGGVTPNNIVYGNVTGGKGFRGPVAERDASAFFGPTSGGISDRFVAGSSGVPAAYQPAFDLSKAQTFYGNDRFVAPPLGSVRVGYTGSYLGTNAGADSQFNLNPLMAPLSTQSQQLGTLTILGTKTTVSGHEFGEQLFQGSLDNQMQQTTYSGSALYGIQSLQGGQEDNGVGLGTGGLNGANGPNSRFQFQNAEERRMRAELQQPGAQQNNDRTRTGDQSRQGQTGQQEQSGQRGQSGAFGQQSQTNNLQQPLESIDNSAFANRSGQRMGVQPMSGNLQTGGSTQQRFTLVTPEMQSTQYSELKKRLERYQSPQQIATEQRIQTQRERRTVSERVTGPTSRAAGGAYAPQIVKPGAGFAPQNGTNSPTPTPPQTPDHPQPTVTPEVPTEPIKIKSLADGVNARGLHELLVSGEGLMHDGKFQSAIDKYNMAQRIAPNNPLIPVGLANAQLGAGAFRSASDTLHQVFQSAEPTLMAQYDVAGWMPADRLETIKSQLNQLSTKDKQDEMPEFLLAYIAYNTGDGAGAKQHLDEARKRSDGKDKVLDRLETDWQLSAKPAAAAPEFNK